MIADEAAHWVVRLSGEVDSNEREQAEAWIDADPRHAVAFVAAETAWEASPHARLRDVLAPAPAPATAPASASAMAARTTVKPTIMSRRSLGLSLLAASTVGAVSLGRVFLAGSDRHETRRGQQSVARLTDGSSIALNTDTRLDVSVGSKRRLVNFIEGEALFTIARDEARPFIVDLGNARVEVLGTAFNIRKRTDVVELTVTHGLVSVIAADGRSTRVSAGKTTLIRPDVVATTDLDETLLRQRVAWQDGYIELNDETLDQAVAEFNRYRDQPILIGDPRIASLAIAGRFGVHDSDAFVTALHASFAITAEHTTDGVVVLRAG
ncbi:FecR family protein [Sphingomonas sp. PP-CE-3G-477]|uniref:FecR family protein n=1 Tax=Sphingomonas sp. PP-CE-3G-477 TaxID=2135660 RepID=UPI000D484E6C|nr:FecR domain-containing protein [Sphingomonas sp. PP-CE-3G-477]PTQ58570.1 FecR family protein [Sphingomonas sp. PP-CE-3G-477]